MSRPKYRLDILLAAGALVAVPAAASAAPKLSAIDKLVAEDEIRNNLALYALLADGDGIKDKDTRTLADKLMAPDVVTEIYYTHSAAPVRILGRDAVAGPQVTPAPPGPSSSVGRHYLVETYFEDITTTTAKTVTTAVHFDLSPNAIGKECKLAGAGACGGVPSRVIMWIYHMNWVKNAVGWQISYNGLRMDD